MADWAAKRFWKETTVVEVEGGFSVHLDGRSVRTPAKAALVVPTRQLAEMIAVEWDAQDGKIDPTTMPVTRGANAAIDKVSLQRAEVADMLSEYGDSDLLCYRADYPVELVERQAQKWGPILDWAAEELGARLEPRTGIMPVPQQPEVLENLRAKVHELDHFELSAFHDLVGLSGSLVLAFAVIYDRLSASQAWELSRIDETFQAEQWGDDNEAVEFARVKQESFVQADKFFRSIKI